MDNRHVLIAETRQEAEHAQRERSERLAEELEAVTRERDVLRATFTAVSKQSDRQVERMARLQELRETERIVSAVCVEQLHAALAWLRAHAQHPPTCGAARGDGCTCGLDALREEP